MNSITTEQARARFTTLPPTLQDAIFSIQNAEIIGQVAEQNHLPDEKIGGIAEAVGFVLLGFIHPEDLPQEISEQTGIVSQISKTISDSIAARIFNTLKQEIDKIYAPVPHDEPGEQPKTLEEIRQPVTGGGPAKIDVSEMFGGKPYSGDGPQPFMIAKTETTKPPTPTVPPVPKPSAPSRPTTATPSSGPYAGEFARLGTEVKKVAPPPAAPQAATTQPTATGQLKPPSSNIASPPAPFTKISPAMAAEKKILVDKEPLVVSHVEPPPTIIHEELTSKPIEAGRDFRLDTLQPKLSEMKAEKGPLRPAVFELGSRATPEPEKKPSWALPVKQTPLIKTPGPAAPQQPKVVHYSEFKTPLDKIQTADTPQKSQAQNPGREIKEITAPPPPKTFGTAQIAPPVPKIAETAPSKVSGMISGMTPPPPPRPPFNIPKIELPIASKIEPPKPPPPPPPPPRPRIEPPPIPPKNQN